MPEDEYIIIVNTLCNEAPTSLNPKSLSDSFLLYLIIIMMFCTPLECECSSYESSCGESQQDCVTDRMYTVYIWISAHYIHYDILQVSMHNTPLSHHYDLVVCV